MRCGFISNIFLSKVSSALLCRRSGRELGWVGIVSCKRINLAYVAVCGQYLVVVPAEVSVVQATARTDFRMMDIQVCKLDRDERERDRHG